MTLNLAHRGARRVAPENTLPAFERALEMGADGCELDVQLSADGHLFVFHDIMLDRMTDGSGPATSFPLAALKEFDAGSHFNEAWRGTPIPTLDEVFDTLPDDAFVNIELKRDINERDGLEEAIVEFIRSDEMHYGLAQVSMPKTHVPGTLESPRRWRRERSAGRTQRPPPGAHPGRPWS